MLLFWLCGMQIAFNPVVHDLAAGARSYPSQAHAFSWRPGLLRGVGAALLLDPVRNACGA